MWDRFGCNSLENWRMREIVIDEITKGITRVDPERVFHLVRVSRTRGIVPE